jgi:hypothetical protein
MKLVALNRSVFCLRFVTYLLLLFVFTACEKLYKKPQKPKILKVNNFILETRADGTQGSATHAIENVWLYVEGNLQGIYQLPARIPLLEEGNKEIKFFAGIKMNGIASTRIDYPFYKSATFNVNFDSDTAFLFENIKVNYFDFVKFSYNENFESTIINLERSGNSQVEMQTEQNTNTALQANFGDAFGQAVLQANDTIFEVSSTQSLLLPTGGAPVYLEMDYSFEDTLSMGIYATSNFGTTTKQQIISILPNTTKAGNDWKKIYVEMAPEVSSNSTAQYYKVYFFASKKSKEATQKFWFDNLKVVHN